MSVVALAKVETHDLLRRAAAPSVRMLMILVAIVGLSLGAGLWGSKMWVPHKEAERWASHHAGESVRWSNLVRVSKGIAAPVSVSRTPIAGLRRQQLEKDGYDTTQPYFYDFYLGYNPADALKFPVDPLFEELMVVCRERVAYHERMRRTWAWTAWMPWVRFEPDPPKPPVGEPDMSQSY
jgi:hypothetical protein